MKEEVFVVRFRPELNEPVWPSAGKALLRMWVAQRLRALTRFRFGSPIFFKKVVVCGHCPSCDFVPHVIKMALIAAHCNGKSPPFLLPFFPHLHNLTPPPSLSLISLMVSMDIIIIHSFYIGAILCSRADSMRMCRM